MKNNKFWGTVMMVVGTTIGGGMLALPLVSYASGFLWSSIFMLLVCTFSIFSSFMILEVNLGMPANANSFSSMAEKTLGKVGKTIVWFIYLFLIYACVVAYIAGESNIIVSYVESTFHFKLSYWQSAIIFTTLIGIVVDCSVRAVDYLNRILVLLKGGLLVGALFLISGYIKCDNLAAIPLHDFSHLKYLSLAAPIFLCAFNFHMIIPTLRTYYGEDASALKKIFILGLLIVFILYAWWSAAVLGVIPLEGANSFANIPVSGGEGELTRILAGVSQGSIFKTLVNGFTNITLVTAFLGSSLGLFDFLADGFKLPNTPSGRLKTAILTFVPPLIIALAFPTAFVAALNYAAICIAILVVIVPSLMVIRSRRLPDFKTSYRMKVASPFFLVVMLIGVIFAVLGILFVFNCLPTLH